MSEQQRSATPQSPTDEPAPFEAWVESLRGNGTWRLDPTRVHYLVALSRRIASQPEPVRALLKEKLHAAMAEHTERFPHGEVRAMRARAAEAASDAACAPLAQLNQYIRSAKPAHAGAEVLGEMREQDELESVRRFRRAWTTSRIQDEVEHAITRKPVNAGPLNSHALVLQSLGLMQDLSPDYLQRFLAHVESLQWLDLASEKHPHPRAGQTRSAKTARHSRQKK